MPKPI